MKYRYSHAVPDKPSTHSLPLDRTTDKNFVNTIARAEPKECADLFISSFGHQITWPKRILSRTSPAAILHYVVDGKGTFNGDEVGSGQFFYTFPNQRYTILQNPDTPMEYYWISFLGTKTDELMKECRFDRVVQIQNIDFSDEIVELFDKVVYGDHTDKDLDLYLLGLLYTLLSYHKRINLLEDRSEKLNKDYGYFQKAMSYIEDSVNKGITVSVSDISGHLHISPSYCRLIFHKYSNHSPQKMILFKRFDRTRSDLELTSYSIKEIAFRAGYHDPSLFSRQFKKIFGISPVEYRENYKKEEEFE
ncbi:MAG: helix-turn-helix domain-containing protein [Clostridia bacterium]|nr:helix-turn-helix domain-containing protein [Clostridia bacterium]MBQ8850789.1 helix-turn-helix domain-containing protein [Clostridia bacterium]